jgi:hypothetical protein
LPQISERHRRCTVGCGHEPLDINRNNSRNLILHTDLGREGQLVFRVQYREKSSIRGQSISICTDHMSAVCNYYFVSRANAEVGSHEQSCRALKTVGMNKVHSPHGCRLAAASFECLVVEAKQARSLVGGGKKGEAGCCTRGLRNCGCAVSAQLINVHLAERTQLNAAVSRRDPRQRMYVQVSSSR